MRFDQLRTRVRTNNVFIVEPANQTYTLELKAEFGYDIENVTSKLSAGTLTMAVKIDGVDVTSLDSESVTTSELTTASTGAKTVAAGATVTIVVTSISGAIDLALSFKITELL